MALFTGTKSNGRGVCLITLAAMLPNMIWLLAAAAISTDDNQIRAQIGMIFLTAGATLTMATEQSDRMAIWDEWMLSAMNPP